MCHKKQQAAQAHNDTTKSATQNKTHRYDITRQNKTNQPRQSGSVNHRQIMAHNSKTNTSTHENKEESYLRKNDNRKETEQQSKDAQSQPNYSQTEIRNQPKHQCGDWAGTRTKQANIEAEGPPNHAIYGTEQQARNTHPE